MTMRHVNPSSPSQTRQKGKDSPTSSRLRAAFWAPWTRGSSEAMRWQPKEEQRYPPHTFTRTPLVGGAADGDTRLLPSRRPVMASASPTSRWPTSSWSLCKHRKTTCTCMSTLCKSTPEAAPRMRIQPSTKSADVISLALPPAESASKNRCASVTCRPRMAKRAPSRPSPRCRSSCCTVMQPESHEPNERHTAWSSSYASSSRFL
mmetsp:Transcript_38305/g.106469  ORF Transcript_38305/g.106469 Transcript_38305/m.106469 type:complete len:205 (-) Transcript_38305:213-827(-)